MSWRISRPDAPGRKLSEVVPRREHATRDFTGDGVGERGTRRIADVHVDQRARGMLRGLCQPRRLAGARIADDQPDPLSGQQIGFVLLDPVGRRRQWQILQLHDELLEKAGKLSGREGVIQVLVFSGGGERHETGQFPDEGFRCECRKRQALGHLARDFCRFKERYLGGRQDPGAGISRRPIDVHVDRPVGRGEPSGERAVRRRVADDEEDWLSVALTAPMSGAQFSKARYGVLDVAPGERLLPVLHLDVDAPPFKLHLDVFVALDFDTVHRQCRRLQQALHGVEMLKKEAAVHGFDPDKLCRIEYSGCAWRR